MYAEYVDKTQTKTKYKQENCQEKHILMIGNRYRMCRNPSQVICLKCSIVVFFNS